jgi:hypothetical protein
MRRWIGLVLFALTLGVAPAAAEEQLDAAAAAVDRATAAPRAEAASVDRMARFLGTTAPALRAERAAASLSWSDLFLAHRVATRGGHPFDKVIAARRSGAPWSEIAEEAGVAADALVQDVGAVWPDAVPTAAASPGAPPPAAAPADGRPGFGRRLLDLFGGKPSDTTDDAASGDRTTDEMRDRMLRGGGRTR